MASPEVLAELRRLVAERDWAQFHSPANLAKSIVIEGAELLEHFQWDEQFDRQAVAHELADVLTYALLLADRLGLDADQIVLDKLAITQQKYPADLAHGRSTKHDRLQD